MLGKWYVGKLRSWTTEKRDLGFAFTLASSKGALYLFCLFFIICFCFIDNIPNQALRLCSLRIASIILARKNWDWLDCIWIIQRRHFILRHWLIVQPKSIETYRKIIYELLAKTPWKTVETERLRYLGINNSLVVRDLVYECLFIEGTNGAPWYPDFIDLCLYLGVCCPTPKPRERRWKKRTFWALTLHLMCGTLCAVT